MSSWGHKELKGSDELGCIKEVRENRKLEKEKKIKKKIRKGRIRQVP